MDLILQSVGLYDIVKIGIPDSILNKPAKLSYLETETMRNHVDIGVDVITKIMNETEENEFLHHALAIAGSHHERWDGKGYPKGLSGEEIPLEARLMAIVVTYDELISWQPYKKTYTHEEAAKVIEEGSGTRFEPGLVDVFFYMEREFREITQKYLLK
jgi:putative two-component system response regulator